MSDIWKQEASKESPNGSNQSPDVTSKVTACAEDVNDISIINAQLPEEVTPKPVPTTGIINRCSVEEDENGENRNMQNGNEGDLNDGSRNISERLSAALVNVNAKEDLVKQHAKVAEEAIAGTKTAVNIKCIPPFLSVIFKINHWLNSIAWLPLHHLLNISFMMCGMCLWNNSAAVKLANYPVCSSS